MSLDTDVSIIGSQLLSSLTCWSHLEDGPLIHCPGWPCSTLCKQHLPCLAHGSLAPGKDSIHAHKAGSKQLDFLELAKKKKKNPDTFLPKEIPNRVQTKSMAQSVKAAATIY